MVVKIKLNEDAFMPERAHRTDAGADLRTPFNFTLKAHDSAVINTGVHIETPDNCVCMVKSKSGLNIKHGITTTGVIDEGFTGDIVVKMINHGNNDIHFNRGDKISQIVIMPVLYPDFEQVDEISGGDRGDGGYGSTGR